MTSSETEIALAHSKAELPGNQNPALTGGIFDWVKCAELGASDSTPPHSRVVVVEVSGEQSLD